MDAVQHQQVPDQLVAEHAVDERGIDQVQRAGEGLAVDLRQAGHRRQGELADRAGRGLQLRQLLVERGEPLPTARSSSRVRAVGRAARRRRPGQPRVAPNIGECSVCRLLPLPRYMCTPQGRHGSKLRTARMMSTPLKSSGPFSSKIGVSWIASS